MTTEFSATASALGYYYQIRYALFALLSGEMDGEISLETMDDITFERDGSPIELIQTKHRISRTASLTDASTDLWKTLRIWSCNLLDNSIDPNRVQLILVTTAHAPQGSIASMLGPVHRNIEQALGRLRQVAAESDNQTNAPAYREFSRLTEAQQHLLLNAIKVMAVSPDIVDIVPQIRRQLALSTREQFIEPVYQRLEGWWFDRTIQCMRGTTSLRIPFSDVRTMINDISEQFREDNLPIDFMNLITPIEDPFEDSQRIFIEQLQLVAVSQPRISKAISDYYKAYQQRSRWIREDLLYVNELESYEQKLVDEWGRMFLIMQEDLAEDASEDDKVRAGRSLYNWVDTQANICIRRQCTEPYVMRGSYQMLASQLRVGWHTQFVERLQQLFIEARGAVT
ncbi:hypothetical protein SPSIL_033700 [Sporomusa silvacetica DSM 10669]|uniref:ABC-three component systems C-terminal domain-containing protein n=1 Tax=Sporomusa silvacetica DSM 10669 TaxID=1123289 RepID=A0ABZ3IN87_9FIRM|nr:ABC-three component system protein [Sporomusa silvacetica]OZC21303.1 hypothetical protein SPSIL_10970 [Sporomusa silvacetica DSM 10669]